ncbi:hypothetical protein BH23ACT3_BH23ACT3_00550 [soil metagenome]
MAPPDPAALIPEAEFAALVGHRFPGGSYRVEHWENWLITDCTGRAPMPDRLVHPIVLFHAPILGANTSIGELFRLGGASGTSGSVGLVGYDWEYLDLIHEDVDYVVEGGIVSAERRTTETGAIEDHLAFRIEMRDGERPVARVTNRWRFYRRRPPAASGGSAGPAESPSEASGGAPIPSWEMPSVDPARMKTMAAVLRDPYPVHWDRSVNGRLGIAGRVINQGPLNLGYIANMLMAWSGPSSIRRLAVSFGSPVLDRDHVVAGGCVREVVDDIAHCNVWLARGDETVVTGVAEVFTPGASRA